MNEKSMNKICFYFHGGGLIFGDPYDLSMEYHNIFSNAGFMIISVPYPLAPPATVVTMIEEIRQFINIKLNQYNCNDYVFFGRSAGAFLMFQAAPFFLPKKLISFYGYPGNISNFMNSYNHHFLSFPKIPKILFENLLSSRDKYQAPSSPYYSLYVYVRQNGIWESITGYRSNTIQLEALPPTLIWHSLFDPDVPFSIAKHLESLIPNSKLIPSFEKRHDTDYLSLDAIKQQLIEFLHEN